MKKTPFSVLNIPVFFFPSLLLSILVIYGIYDSESFLLFATDCKKWIIDTVGFLFSWSSFVFILLIIWAYFSPLGKKKIGGKSALPLLSKWSWFSITLCTTIATGILFWGMAEPLYHRHSPPEGLTQVDVFAMSTLFQHWSFTPYAVYTIAGLVFAWAYYNLKTSFSLSAVMVPIFGLQTAKRLGTPIDILCLTALIMGMSASLGAGIFAISGGLDLLFGIEKSSLSIFFIGLGIVLAFVLSAASGLQRGIRVLSDINAKAFILLALLIFILGPSLYILSLAGEGMIDYLIHFPTRSIGLDPALSTQWMGDWTTFYLANWFAWAPIAALFLGRIAVGYSVRAFIRFNLIYPALFSIAWMMIFGGISLEVDAGMSGGLYDLVKTKGEEQAMFTVLANLPWGMGIAGVTLVMVFVSYVTAADSNITAMSAMSTKGFSIENPKAPLFIKIFWGLLIALITWVMLSTSGIDGIRILSILGGFPALFLLIMVGGSLIRIILTSYK